MEFGLSQIYAESVRTNSGFLPLRDMNAPAYAHEESVGAFHPLSLDAKRLFDLFFASIGLVCLSPLLLAIAAFIRMSSPGPVIYAQSRVGLKGKLFRLYKFRTMVPNADKMGSSVTKFGDNRITPIGRILRSLKMDELPQLWNVLIGDMSFVGPRPDTPDVVATYSGVMRMVLNVRPGITSIASLHLRDEQSLLADAADPDDAYINLIVPRKVALAAEHVTRDSIWFDLGVLFMTVWTLTVGRLLPQKENWFYQDLKLAVIRDFSTRRPRISVADTVEVPEDRERLVA